MPTQDIDKKVLLKERIEKLYGAGLSDREIAAQCKFSFEQFLDTIAEYIKEDEDWTKKMEVRKNTVTAKAKMTIKKKIDLEFDDDNDLEAKTTKYHLDRRSEEYNPKSAIDLNTNINVHEMTDEEKARLKNIIG